MRIPRRLVTLRTLCAAALASSLVVSHVQALDHVVQIRCVQESTGLTYELDPNPVVITAGIDRLVFRSPSYDDVSPCANYWQAPSDELNIWGYPYEPIYLWWYGDTSRPQGPFCEPGTHPYFLTLRGSHGEIHASFPAVIEVTAPSQPAETATQGPSIGVFAEPQAISCVLPASLGPRRAYVCMKFDGSTDGAPWAAEFRVVGFPTQ